jgi:hypothetical protein
MMNSSIINYDISLPSGIFKILDFISGLLSLISRFGTSLKGGQSTKVGELVRAIVITVHKKKKKRVR